MIRNKGEKKRRRGLISTPSLVGGGGGAIFPLFPISLDHVCERIEQKNLVKGWGRGGGIDLKDIPN